VNGCEKNHRGSANAGYAGDRAKPNDAVSASGSESESGVSATAGDAENEGIIREVTCK